MVEAYWHALIEEGVDPQEYPYEQLFEDYINYGATALVSRLMYFAGLAPHMKATQLVTTNMENFITRHNVTADQVGPPIYGTMDSNIWIYIELYKVDF